MKYLAVLGRQVGISLAELEALYGEVCLVGRGLAEFEMADEPDIARLGGSLKLARELEGKVEDFLLELAPGHKLVIGVSDYSKRARRAEAWREGLRLKKNLTKAGRSVRILSNNEATLSTATVYHNGLGRKTGRVELLRVDGKWYVGVGVQNIEAYARRDQARPARDAKVGMLPPKLAQILINLCGPLPKGARVLDPFCGTGVVLQEAWLMGYKPYGSDLNEKMVKYSRKNMEWLAKSQRNAVVDKRNLTEFSEDMYGSAKLNKDMCGSAKLNKSGHDTGATEGERVAGLLTFHVKSDIIEGDACNLIWGKQIDAVACETYLGRPMSKAPTLVALREEKQRCKDIILGFLRNILPQINSGTPLCLGVPAWLKSDEDNSEYSRLNILDEIDQMGYNVIKFKSVRQQDLLYYRDGQVVAREIIVLRKK